MNKLRRFVSWSIIVLIIFILGLIANILFFNPIQSIYNISARSEVVEFLTLDDNLSNYILYGATIFNDEGVVDSHFDGTLQINENTIVTITRLGKGDINITLEHKEGKSVGYFLEGLKRDKLPIKESLLEIYIDSIESKLKEGKHHHFIIEGKTKIGRNVYHMNYLENPSILYNGKISILGKSYWGKDYFEAGTREFHSGDRVIFDYTPKVETNQDLSMIKGNGFVRIDDEPAMKLEYRRRAKNVMIFKSGPKTEESRYAITVSLLERFINDKLFWGLSLLLGFCAFLMTVLTFIYDTHYFLIGKKNKHNQSSLK